jgi:predicted ATPase/transcriptional regulator with XRE-family HTH domain
VRVGSAKLKVQEEEKEMSNSPRFSSQSLPNQEIRLPRLLKTAQFSFGKLLKLYRERATTKLTRLKLAGLVGVSEKTIHNWEDDISLPTAHNLKKLLEVYLAQKLLTAQQEQAEAYQLWQKRQELDERNTFGEFDEVWFTNLLSQSVTSTPVTPLVLPLPAAKMDSAEIGDFVNFPKLFDSFIGRETEQARLLGLIEDENIRLLTLTGTGGVGKTRLAIQVAEQVRSIFEGGVFFVPLADINDGPLTLSLIAQTLGVREIGTNLPTHSLVYFLEEQLKAKKVLLLLDNFEQLVDKAALAVRDLLQRLPNLKCLITSRQLLGVSGEHQFLVNPLPVPTGEQSLEGLVENESARLFVARCRALRPDFVITAQNMAVITELCNRLEGIPLALELAAGRIQIMTPWQMLEQLSRRFTLLKTRQQTTVARQQTLWDTINWSYRLLSPELQRFFLKLSVIRGGWTLQAAEVICQEADSLDLLAQLVECSLITTREHTFDTTGRTEIRFRMLETLREFGQSQLTNEERHAFYLRYVNYYLALAEKAKIPDLETVDRLERFDVEHENFRSAICWCMKEDTTAEIGLRLAADLWHFWYVRGYLAEGRRWLEVVLNRTEGMSNTLARAQAYNGAGCLAERQGDYVTARSLLSQSLAIYEALDDKVGIKGVRNNLEKLLYQDVKVREH